MFQFLFNNTGDTALGDDADMRFVRNDGTGNLHTYINANSGTSPTMQTDGYAYKTSYDPTGGKFYHQYESGSNGDAIAWTNFMIYDLANDLLDMQGNRIADIANPTAAQDAATKAYVD